MSSITGILLPVGTAILGAIGAGIVQTVSKAQDRKSERESTLVALASEVGALCQMLRDTNLLSDATQALRKTQESDDQFFEIEVYISSSHSVVYDALISKIGILEAAHTSSIVRFYTQAKLIMDCIDHKGLEYDEHERDNAIANLELLISSTRSALRLGDMIIQFPEVAIDR